MESVQYPKSKTVYPWSPYLSLYSQQLQKHMMLTRHSLRIDDKKDVCAFAFETWKNVYIYILLPPSYPKSTDDQIKEKRRWYQQMSQFLKCNENDHGLLWEGSEWMQRGGAELWFNAI